MAIVELPDRRAVANWLPAASVGIEIGVNKGEFAELLAKRCREYHGVDWWEQTGQEVNKRATEARLQQYGPIVHLHDADAASVLPGFPNKYFDWVYIDADHWYRSVVRDIALSLPKVRPGGIIAGHDFVNGRNHWGTSVIRAVCEAVQARQIEIVAFSREPFVDWIAKKPG